MNRIIGTVQEIRPLKQFKTTIQSKIKIRLPDNYIKVLYAENQTSIYISNNIRRSDIVKIESMPIPEYNYNEYIIKIKKITIKDYLYYSKEEI